MAQGRHTLNSNPWHKARAGIRDDTMKRLHCLGKAGQNRAISSPGKDIQGLTRETLYPEL